jgi:hypothetical protein
MRFGVISSGKKVSMPLALRNRQSTPQTLERIAISCPCIRVAAVPVRLKPDETKALTVTFDPSAEPDFEGGLSVEVEGHLADGRVAFVTHIDLEVKRVPDRRGD